MTAVTLASAGAATSATFTAPGPTYAITASAAVGSGLGNYAISYHTGTLTLTQAVLTVTAADQSKTYGDGFSFTGSAGPEGNLFSEFGHERNGVFLKS